MMEERKQLKKRDRDRYQEINKEIRNKIKLAEEEYSLCGKM